MGELKKGMILAVIFFSLNAEAATPFEKCGLFFKSLFTSQPRIRLSIPKSNKVYPSSVEELLAMGEFQRALWKSKSLELNRTIKSFLKNSVVVETTMNIGGKSGARKVILEGWIDGKKIRTTAILKNSSVDREIAAHELDKLLGTDLTPMITTRQCGNQNCSIQLFVDNTISGKDLNIERWSGTDDPAVEMYDYLISNTDRHHENFLFTLDEHRLVAIDQGQTLGFHGFRNTLSPKGLNVKWDANTKKFFNSLKTLPDEKIIERLKPLLMKSELDDLLVRKKKLLEYLEKLTPDA